MIILPPRGGGGSDGNQVTTLWLVKYWPVDKGSRLGRLLTVRWSGQLADGLFQSSLASFVLFSPERQPSAISAAVAFTVVLLPYSFIGPYVGIFLDRFSRKKIVALSNLLRALDLVVIALLVKSGHTGVELTLFVLVAFGINRLILSALSAGLPLMVERKELIASNALAVTGGTIGVVLGGGLGIGIKKLIDSHVTSDQASSILILIGASLYLFSSFSAGRLGTDEIGPQEHELPTEHAGFTEMFEGFHILAEHKDSLRAITATAVQRGLLTALTLMLLLLERNTFNPASNPDAGLSGFGVALAITGIGVGIGAVITPFAVGRIGRHSWIRAMVLFAIPFIALFAISTNRFTTILAGFFVGLSGQAIKVTSDALVQSKIDDEYRGRTFAFYDVAVNGSIVLGALLAALLLPQSGRSLLLPGCIIAILLVMNFGLLNKANFSADSHSTK